MERETLTYFQGRKLFWTQCKKVLLVYFIQVTSTQLGPCHELIKFWLALTIVMSQLTLGSISLQVVTAALGFHQRYLLESCASSLALEVCGG